MKLKQGLKKYVTSDFLNTMLNQLWRLVSGPLMLILIPLYLTAEEQGYWYTFGSLAALAVFADLGFSTIILQFSAHEFAFLKFEDNGKISGDDVHFGKLSTLFVFCVKWTIAVVLVAFPMILCVGFFILSQKSTIVSWMIPWIIYGAGSALAFLNSIVFSFFEGCNSVGKIQKIRLKMAISMSSITLVALLMHFSLYALAISLVCGSLFGSFLVYNQFGAAIRDLLVDSRKCKYRWKQEFLPLIWRYAISWASGYFIFQMYTPMAFQYHGVVEAGKIGISISLWVAIFSLSNIWMYINTPKLNMYVSKKEWSLLDAMFYRSLLRSVGSFLLGGVAVFAIMLFFKEELPLINRFVSSTSMLFLAICWLLQLIVNSLATYLRAHKEEPLVIPSFVSAVYIAITTFLCASFLSADYLFLGYFSSYFWGLPWVVYIFCIRRRKHTYA